MSPRSSTSSGCRQLWALGLALLVACGGEPSEVAAPQVADEGAQAGAASVEPAREFLHGRVVDRRTGQGVPLVFVELELADTRLALRTDAAGDFAHDAELAAGKYRARVRLEQDAAPLVAHPLRLEHAPRGSAQATHVLRVDVGPSYALDFSAAASYAPQRWEARLVERNARGVDREWSWHRLQADERPLLRYASLEFEPDPEFHARLELRFAGGDWFGRAPVKSTSSVEIQDVRLRLVQYAAFGGVVVDSEGGVVPRAEILLHQEHGDVLPAYSHSWRRERVDAQGAFRFDQNLEPGRYHVRVLAEGRAPTDFDVRIAEGGLVGYVLEVARVTATHSLSGHVAGAPGNPPPAVILSLQSVDGTLERVLHPAQGESPARGAWSARSPTGGLDFGFEALPAGQYELSLFALDGLNYAPSRSVVQVPGELLRIAAPTNAARAVVAFELETEPGAAPLEHFHAIFRAEGWWNPEGHRLTPGAQVAALPLESSITWMVYAHGYQPVYGDITSFGEPEAPQGPRLARLQLEPGWGAEFVLLDAGPGGLREDEDTYTSMARAHGSRPLAGVRVLADEVLVGESDARGVVRLALDSKPTRIAFELSGWRAIESSSYRDQGLVESPPEELRNAVIWMTTH